MNISNEQLEQQLKDCPGVEYVQVTGDGYHYHLTLVTDEFKDLSKVARQRWVYAHLNAFITSGQLHALTMATWTNDEWEKKRG